MLALRSLALALLVLPDAVALGQEPVMPRDVFVAVAKATVGVRADDCPSSRDGLTSRFLQGFFQGARGEIVTARHGIAGCRDITVTLYGGDDLDEVVKTAHADVMKTYRRADLALLKLRADPGDPLPSPLPVVSAGAARPVFAVARWVGASGPRDKLMRVANGSRHLRGILNKGAREQLEKSGSPALDLEVLNLDVGVIVQGTSGAPIVDTTGAIVAVADGGLENGVSGITWAVPSAEISRLRGSSEAVPTHSEGIAVAVQFASEPVSPDDAPVVRCNGFELTRLRTTRFADIQRTADDPAGLQYVTQFATQLGFRPASDEFDVWQHLESGAAVAVPVGASLEEAGGGNGDCSVAVADAVDLRIRLERTNGTHLDAQRASMQFEWALTAGSFWQMDPTASYLAPLLRPDGLIVTRKKANQVVAPFDAVFETLATRGTMFVGYAAVLRGEPTLGQKLAWCAQGIPSAFGGSPPEQCDAVRDLAAVWSRGFVAVQLTTFTRSL